MKFLTILLIAVVAATVYLFPETARHPQEMYSCAASHGVSPATCNEVLEARTKLRHDLLNLGGVGQGSSLLDVVTITASLKTRKEMLNKILPQLGLDPVQVVYGKTQDTSVAAPVS